MPTFDTHAYFGTTPFSTDLATRASILETMRRTDLTGIALISALAAQCDFVAGNRRLREIVAPEDGLFGWVTLNAGYSAESQEEQRRHQNRRGMIGAALFAAPGRPVTLEDAREILNAQRRYAKPVALPIPDAEAVHQARLIAAEFPAMKFVFLGMGGEDWRIAVAAAKKHLNIYLEISGSLDTDKIAQASSVITPRKLLYGSGLPGGSPELTLALVESAPTLTRPDRNRILSENATALLRTEVEEAAEEETAENAGEYLANA
ncbi:MAG: amidohydrolase family protein [Janthinobacterium lividum]